MIKFSRRRRFLLLLFSSGPGPGPFATIIYLPLCMLFWMFIAFALGRLLTLSDGVSVFIGALFTLPTLVLVNLWAVRVGDTLLRLSFGKQAIMPTLIRFLLPALVSYLLLSLVLLLLIK
ncbi:hypothetical protein [Shewanella algae]|uniref:hypothetical protein n=2 Tax=Shewanella TaxID=22 RepID=UPI001AAC6FE2|nr:hypothetical protein [Shewanella algae]MBO2575947.1 hypothetical protein [Shewanella algae]MBO2681486.1 hypothetical protein [Shewanella algae]MBZ4677839.1 hypothetical protein [Shewanella sp.]BCV63249.1 hypothetical protein TUM17386_29200 [Shewanella algae]